jgi:hypothetical protein
VEDEKMKLNMQINFNAKNSEVAENWEDLCNIIKRGKVPCINFTRWELDRVLEDRKHLFSDDIIVTSKGTDIIDYFEIDDIMVDMRPIRECTTKELRKAHNIRKMFIAGAFDHYREDEDEL